MDIRTHFRSGLLALVAAVAFIGPAHSLTPKQEERVKANLIKVHEIASEFDHAETMQAILLQESTGGLADPRGDQKVSMHRRSYGMMQVQLVAARSILSRNPALVSMYFDGRKYKSLTDHEIANLLIYNDDANVRIAVYHFELYYRLCRGNWDKTVAAYNVGIGTVQRLSNPGQFRYVVSVRSRIHKTVRPFNLKNIPVVTKQQIEDDQASFNNQ